MLRGVAAKAAFKFEMVGYCFQMEPRNDCQKHFLARMKVALKSKTTYQHGNLGLAFSHVRNFFRSTAAQLVYEEWYNSPSGLRRVRSTFLYPNGNTVIIVEVYDPPVSAFFGLDTIMGVSLDRYQLYKTESVYPSTSFMIPAIRTLKPSQFFETMWNHLENIKFLD